MRWPFRRNRSVSSTPVTELGQLPKLDQSGRRIDVTGEALFPHGTPSPDDIDQGRLGNCYFLATTAAVARSRPDVAANKVTPLDDGTYVVHLPDGDVTVDGQVRVDERGASAPWVLLLEKAYALSHSSGSGYANISGGSSRRAFQEVWGLPSAVHMFNEGDETFGTDVETFTIISAELAGRRAITVGTKKTSHLPQGGFHMANHVLTVVAADVLDGVESILVRNPAASLSARTLDDLARMPHSRAAPEVGQGYMWVSHEDFIRNFSGYTIAEFPDDFPGT